MVGHLLLGMLSPVLLVRAAPVSLALRALPVTTARTLVRLLSSRPVRFVSHPVTAGTGNLVGLWLLYTTSLYSLSHAQDLAKSRAAGFDHHLAKPADIPRLTALVDEIRSDLMSPRMH